MDHPLGILILGLLSVSQLWEGVQGGNGYDLYAPGDVAVQTGLCVVISCNFTFPKSDPGLEGPLKGYWYRNDGSMQEAFATNDAGKAIVRDAQGRFRLSENVEEGDCSLFITDAQPGDEGTYYFRMEKGDKGKWNFKASATSVRVTATPEPEIQTLAQLQAGQPVNLTCTAASCPWNRSRINWKFAANLSGISSLLSNGNEISSVVLNFVPSAADNGRLLTCKATYGSGFPSPVSREKRVPLNVSYPPQRLRISGELLSSKQPAQNLTGLSQVEAQEGDVLQLRCEAEGNPSPNVTWLRSSPSQAQQSTAGDQLTLDNVQQQDMGGYTCRAQNAMGTNEITFQVHMAFSPQICNQSKPSCWREDGGFRCSCSICSYPEPEIQWVVDGNTFKGNASSKEMEVTSWSKANEATSILHLKGIQEGQRFIRCWGNSSSGETSTNFLLYSFKEGYQKENIIYGVVGALVMFVILAVILVIVLVSRSQKHSQVTKPRSDPEPFTDRSVLVFGGNPFIAKGSDVTTPPSQEEPTGVPTEPEKPEKTPDDNYDNPQDLYYATIQFSGLKPVPEVTSEEGPTEYAEIRPRNPEPLQGRQEGQTQGDSSALRF